MHNPNEPPAETGARAAAGQRPALPSGVVLLLAALLATAVVLVAVLAYLDMEMSIQTFVETIRGWGAWGVAGSIGLMVVHSFVPFPAEFLAFANGMLYGPYWGTLITWSGAMIGAAVAFGLSRRLGRPFVERMVSERHWETLDDWAARNGWQAVLVGRFFPVIAFNLINYAAGLTRISWWQFLWTTGLGILPMTAIMVAMGDNMEHLGWEAWAGLLLGGLVLWLILKAVRRRA